MIRKVRAAVSLPLIVGGGIRSGEQARLACEAGADLIVVGNAVEQTPGLIAELAAAIKTI
jgi:putative glycerol-1-phosphate prenyltransferase